MKNLLSKIIAVLTFFGLVDDHDGRWNWTTATLIVVLVGIPFNVLPPGFDLGAMLLALLARAHKKSLGVKAQGQSAMTQLVAEVKTQVDAFLAEGRETNSALTAQLQKVAETQENQSKVLIALGEEQQRVSNQLNPAPGVKGFRPPR